MITHVLPDLETFLSECRTRAVRGIAVQEVWEIRPSAAGVSGVDVGVVRFSTLLAYDAGEVIRARIDNPPADLLEQVHAVGVPVRRVNKNLG